MIMLPEENIFYEPLDSASQNTVQNDVCDRERQNARGNETENMFIIVTKN